MSSNKKRRSRLSYEILGLFAVCFIFAMLLYGFFFFFGIGLVESYCELRGIALDDAARYGMENTVLGFSFVICAVFFCVLFLILFGERLAYIRSIIKGIEALRAEEYAEPLPLQGKNELTELARSINEFSEARREVREKERRLHEEREELIRSLSHDIRTPLTSVLSYTELLAAKPSPTAEEYAEYLSLVQKKSAQIKALTDILLDGGKRTPEYFDDARLLMEQLAAEFEEALEDTCTLAVTVPEEPFSGSFDVGELRRIFDNLISNALKYAEPSAPVRLDIAKNADGLLIRQSNAVRTADVTAESYRMGLQSIRRIAQNYAGSVRVSRDEKNFVIEITLSEF